MREGGRVFDFGGRFVVQEWEGVCVLVRSEIGLGGWLLWMNEVGWHGMGCWRSCKLAEHKNMHAE